MSHSTSKASYGLMDTKAVFNSEIKLGRLPLSTVFPTAVVPVGSRKCEAVALTKDELTGALLMERLERDDMFCVSFRKSSDAYIVLPEREGVADGDQRIAQFVGEGDAADWAGKLNVERGNPLGTPQPTHHFILRSNTGNAPFVAAVGDPYAVEPDSQWIANVLNAEMAGMLAALLNRGLASPDPMADGDPDADVDASHESAALMADVKGEINSLAGRMLTILDAAIGQPAQNTALKSLVRKEIRSTLTNLYEAARNRDMPRPNYPAGPNHLAE